MNSLVVYGSTAGNTRQLAKKIASVLAEYGRVECRAASEMALLDVQGIDLLILGCPTLSHGLWPTMRMLLENTPARMLEGISVATFETQPHLFPQGSPSAAQLLAQRLHKAGARLLSPSGSFFLGERESPLETGELERAMQWAHQMIEQCEAIRGKEIASTNSL